MIEGAYRGIEYKVLQTTTRGIWKWSVYPPNAVPIFGSAKSLSSASVAAKRAIIAWLKQEESVDS
jgi:hypothetical protein